MPPEKRVVRVYVYKDEGFIDLADSYKVYPPVVILRANDKFEDEFQIVNTTQEEASWTPPDVFDVNPNDPPEKIPKGTKSKEWKLKKKDKILVVEYKVKVDGHHAHGNSDPRIIIDP